MGMGRMMMSPWQMMQRSVGGSGGTGASDLPALVLPLKFQELLDDLIGVDLELIGEVGANFVLELFVLAVELEVALAGGRGTWYFRREDSLSLEGSKRSFTFNLDIAPSIKQYLKGTTLLLQTTPIKTPPGPIGGYCLCLLICMGGGCQVLIMAVIQESRILGGWFNINFNMSEVKIENIEGNFEAVLELVGQESFVNWEGFTKSSSQLSRQMEDLAKQLTIFRDVQQRRFISTMKQLKGYDIPDLIKTVKSKKLPKEALKTILNRFQLNGQKLELLETTDSLKTESKKLYDSYTTANEALLVKLSEAATLLQERIVESGVLNEVATQPKELVSTFKHNFDESQLELVASSIQVEYLPGTVDTLHIKTYAQIVEKSQDLIKQEYKRLTQDARTKQRGLFKEPKKYIESLVEYLTNTEVLVIEGQKAIAKRLGVTAEKMEETENTLMEKGLAQNLLLIQSALRTRVKESLAPEKEASLEQAKEILKYQVNELNNKVVFFKDLFASLERTPENFQLIPMLLALSLNDLVFEKYGLEEEDFMKNVGDNVIMTNPEIMGVFREMETAIIKLMQELGIISPEAGQYMQAQAQIPGGQLPGGQIPNGLPPGVNPMELLQMQQMQQMQQFEQFQKMMQQQAPK